jgi:hypothetical protein
MQPITDFRKDVAGALQSSVTISKISDFWSMVDGLENNTNISIEHMPILIILTLQDIRIVTED